ncbi:putative sulfate transporter [Viridothelium virens]|uniref:Putative sulfate transporter n=1 Tax=Viridothelium virens TaxID=1048519 RepID=A0A6A6HBW0_VIRVR|nr:putative sulfate transporter [Viridothelium virens]
MSADSTRAKVGHGLARILGIKLDYRNEMGRDNDSRVTQGESVFSVESADDYVEQEPTVAEWFRDHLPSGQQFLQYCRSLFPFTTWIHRYNLQWLIGDLIAGITVGAVVVPQGMAYAQLATLPAQYGLYSSFMGVLIYWFFATSKDITIGPVAVLSTVTGNVLIKVQDKTHNRFDPQDVAGALAIIGGAIVCFLGVTRLGWLVDFISLAAISAFMTGSALNIAVGQIPTMMGITGFSTRDSTYKVVINILKHLGRTKLDAAMGLTALFMLYAIRSAATHGSKRFPNRRKAFFYMSTLRTIFVILLYTLISWLVNRHHRSKPKFKILGPVPRGFKDAKVPYVTTDMISSFAGDLPATVIVLLIEHISIAKSFGRVNNYQINPSQELVAIGVTNLLGPFLGAYPATGSFSRTAIKSKAGVRTPFAGVITAIVVLIALYGLTAVFFYIPQASLSGVIIHAVLDLITPPNTVYQFWRISPLEVIIFFAGVLVTVFSSIENGVYTTISVSAALLLYRVFKARGRFLGRVKVHSVVGDRIIRGNEPKYGTTSGNTRRPNTDDNGLETRNIFLPIDHHDGTNPRIALQTPYPGVFMYRFSEGYNYPNANHYLDYMVHTIFQQTRRTNPMSYPKKGDRPWNDPGPRHSKDLYQEDDRPTLKAIILDFSSVNNVDITSIQHLIDVRNQLDRYVSPEMVEWHFAHINNRWTKRALASAGFGYPKISSQDDGFHRWKPVFSVAELGGIDSAAEAAEYGFNRAEAKRHSRSRSRAHADNDIEDGQVTRRDFHATADGDRSSSQDSVDKTLKSSRAYAQPAGKSVVVQGLNRPSFHMDLTSALQSAIANIERYEDGRPPVASREEIIGGATSN